MPLLLLLQLLLLLTQFVIHKASKGSEKFQSKFVFGKSSSERADPAPALAVIHLGSEWSRQANSIGRCKIYFVNCISGTFVKRQNIYQRCLAERWLCWLCLLLLLVNCPGETQTEQRPQTRLCHAPAAAPKARTAPARALPLSLAVSLSASWSVGIAENVIRVEALGGQLSSDATDMASSSSSAGGECKARGEWVCVTR